MPGTAAQSIGTTLARLGRTTSSPAAGDDAPTSREVIFDLVEAADEPMTIDGICRLTGLHANTVRTHLDVLHAAGRVTRRQSAARGPGRPPWAYAVAEGARSVRATLAAKLMLELDGAPPELVREAARRWAAAARLGLASPGVPDATDPDATEPDAAEPGSAEPVGPGAGPADDVDAATAHRPAADPDEAVHRAAAALTELGFDARVDAVGDRIELRSCPYAALIADRPLICEIHAALLGELLAESGQPVTLRRLDIFARPGLCVAHLNRPDLVPARTVWATPPSEAPGPETARPPSRLRPPV